MLYMSKYGGARKMRGSGIKTAPMEERRQAETDVCEWDKQDGGIYHTTAHTYSAFRSLHPDTGQVSFW